MKIKRKSHATCYTNQAEQSRVNEQVSGNTEKLHSSHLIIIMCLQVVQKVDRIKREIILAQQNVGLGSRRWQRADNARPARSHSRHKSSASYQLVKRLWCYVPPGITLSR
jgi:hypothetical protein